jgi:serine/threonine-protein kinase RsbW
LQAQKPFYTLQIPSSLEGLASTIGGALNALRDRGWIDESSKFQAHLCLEEALVNAIQHGNQCDSSRQVRLEMWEDGECCRILVFDEGPGFQTEDVPEPTTDQARGRGLCLIKHFMDHVEFHNARHCLEMIFNKGRLATKK